MKTQEQWQAEEMYDEAREAHKAGHCRFDTCALCWAEHEALATFLEDAAEEDVGEDDAVPLQMQPEVAAIFSGEDDQATKWDAEATEVYIQRKEIEGRVKERTERAMDLTCEPSGLADGVWHVEGGTDPDGHTVNLHAEWGSVCTCGSHLWRHELCKHLMRVLLELGESFSDGCPDFNPANSTGTYKPGIFSRAVQRDLENAAYRAAKKEAGQ